MRVDSCAARGLVPRLEDEQPAAELPQALLVPRLHLIAWDAGLGWRSALFSQGMSCSSSTTEASPGATCSQGRLDRIECRAVYEQSGVRSWKADS